MMIRTIRLLMSCLLLSVVATGQPSFLQSSFGSEPSSPQTSAKLLSRYDTVEPGQEFYLYLSLDHPEGWYSYYYNNSVDSTWRPELNLVPIEGVTYGAFEYSIPKDKMTYGIPSYVYLGENYFRVLVKVAEDVVSGTELRIQATAAWQMCKDSCLNEESELSLTLSVAEQAQLNGTSGLDTYFTQGAPRKVMVKQQDGGIQLLVSGELVSAYFYDLDGQTQVGGEQAWTFDGEYSSVELKADQGNLMRDSAVAPRESLRGYLKADGLVQWVNLSLGQQDVLVNPTPETESTASAAGVGQLTLPAAEELAALYDGDQPIDYVTLKEAAPVTFWLALGGAFLGGILLNLMPCVFPVLSLKILSFVEKAGEAKWKVRLHGALFTLGVVLSMLVLASVLFLIKAQTGQAVNWGQQMGDSRFVAGIIVVLFLFGLNMAGVFELGTSLTALGGRQGSSNGYVQTIFSGVLTTVIATPCSGPFLGAAMGYTLDQSLPIALVIFTVFALGISFPYLLLSFFPSLTAKLPRPGLWMETLKKVLAFGMFAAAAFFLQTFAAQTGGAGSAALVMALVVIGLGAYFYGHWTLPHLKKWVRYGLGFGLSLLVLLLGVKMSWSAATEYKAPKVATSASKTGVQWVSWQPGIVEYLRSEGYQVWVDYTAAWCATCQVNKKRLFGNKDFVSTLDTEKMIFVKVDMTDTPPEMAKDLSRVNRVTIPVNLLYSSELSEPAILLEEVISIDEAREALDKL